MQLNDMQLSSLLSIALLQTLLLVKIKPKFKTPAAILELNQTTASKEEGCQMLWKGSNGPGLAAGVLNGPLIACRSLERGAKQCLRLESGVLKLNQATASKEEGRQMLLEVVGCELFCI